MSLVGNLEDLSLGDILQIISLSQKSGVLALSSDHGSGRIVFRSGMVQAACIKGQANNLHDLLVGGGFIEAAAYESSLARSQDLGVPVEEVLASDDGLDAERIDALIRDSVEAAILEMFSWPSGDFSFDVRSELDPDDPHLIMPSGINAQYLAMEGVRLRDERERDAVASSEIDPDAETDPGVEASPAVSPSALDAIFGDEPLETDPIESSADLCSDNESTQPHAPELELDILETDSDDELLELDSIVEGDDPSAPPTAETIEMELLEEDALTATDALVSSVVDRTVGAEVEAAASEQVDALPAEPVSTTIEISAPTSPEIPLASAARKMPVVLIDSDVTVLEWVKAAIQVDFARVHVFQQADQGLSRIRQYLIRGETPLVLISPETPIDPLSGIHGLADFVKRLKAQAPRLFVIGLREVDDASTPMPVPAALDAVIDRPARHLLCERSADASETLAGELRQILARAGSGESAPTASSQADGLRFLKEATAKLQEASSRGEILPVVLDFASEIFARVAILSVREDEVFAIAGRGIAVLEVDPLESAPPVSFDTLEPGWIRKVLDSNEALVAPPETASDQILLDRFGGDRPESVYLGPIESDSAVVALLYGDQASGPAPIPDTSALEVVLHHAGLALDRVALERALWEADAD